MLGALGGGAGSAIGGGILRHVLGGRQAPVESALGQASGLDSAKVGQIMANKNRITTRIPVEPRGLILVARFLFWLGSLQNHSLP